MISNIPSIVEIEKVTFLRKEKLILDQVDVRIPKGKITAIMGPSGCGKTTLLRLIGGQILPEQGMVRVLGSQITNISRKDLYKLRKQMGMLFQSGALFTDLSVFENVAFPLREHTNLPEDMVKDLVFMKLEAVGLRGAHSLMPSELSGGMRKRIGLARTMILKPEIMLYDEPTTGLDPITSKEISELIQSMKQNYHVSSIIITHDIACAKIIADRVLVMDKGVIVAEGTFDEMEHSKDNLVNSFFK